jgi:hypothetical protein
MAPLASRHLEVARALLVGAARRAVSPEMTTSSVQHLVLRRGLSVNHTQSVTLGVIVVYAVVIALLWNLPYVRWSLWPFKVSAERVQDSWRNWY